MIKKYTYWFLVRNNGIYSIYNIIHHSLLRTSKHRSRGSPDSAPIFVDSLAMHPQS